MAWFLCVREHHRHSCRFSSDDERAKVFPKALDFGFSDFLLFGLVCYFRHTTGSIRLFGTAGDAARTFRQWIKSSFPM